MMPSLRRHGFTVLLLLSGFCGISYEVLYARLLSNFIGDQFVVNAAILLTFMLGIGCGTLYAHRLWRWLWLIEGAIGLYGASFALGAGWIESAYYASPLLQGTLVGALLVCFLLLWVPAFLIGCSLPLFAGYLSRMVSGRVFAHAYTIYNFGAALTVLVVEFGLLRKLGLQKTVLTMAALNGLVALGLRLGYGGLRCQREDPDQPLWLPKHHLLALAMASIGSAVFQLLMVKLAEFFLGPFRETFAIILALVLLGIAAGSALVKWRRIGFGPLLIAGLVGLLWLVAGYELVTHGYAALHPGTLDSPISALLLKVGALALLMGVPAVAFGATIPALLVAQGNVARDSGRLLCISSVANAAGFLLMALVLHRSLDYGLLIVTVALFAALGLLVYAGFRGRLAWGAGGFLVAIVALHALRWDENLLYVGYESFGSSAELKQRRAFVAPQKFKGSQDVFSLNREGEDESFFINGYISFYLGSPAEKVVGALPCLFAPRTDNALVLGLGSGVTAGTTALLMDRMDGVEINPVVVQNLHRMSRHNFDIVNNPRARIVVDDGLHFVRASPQRYSLIINTVTSPRYFSSAKLYTRDFLDAVRQRLTPDGVYVTWVDARIGSRGLDIILATVQRSFEHCGLFGVRSGYFLLFCSGEPLRLRQPEAAARQPLLTDYLKRQGLPAEDLPYALLTTNAFPVIRDAAAPVNTMDYPALEFEMARLNDPFSKDFVSRLARVITLDDVAAVLKPAMKFDLLRLGWITERLYENSEITSRRLALAEAIQPDFFEAFQQYKRAQFTAWTALANRAEVYHQFGTELLLQRRYAEAIEAGRQALALDARHNDAWFNLATGCEKLGQFPAALTNYLQELKVDPGDRRVLLSLARIHAKLKEYDQALTYLQRAAREQDRAEVHLQMSLVLQAMGRAAEAEAEYQRSLSFGRKPVEPEQPRPRGAADR